MKKVIFVNNTAAINGGALTVLKQFLEEIKQRKDESKIYYFFVTADLREYECKYIKIIDNINGRKMIDRIKWDNFGVKAWAKENNIKPDLIISLQNIAVNFKGVPQIIYLHQPLPYSEYSKWNPLKSDERKMWIYTNIYKKLIHSSIKKDMYVSVQTQWMKDALIQNGISNDKIIISKPKLNEFNITDIESVSLDEKRFVYFYPAAEYKYKNHKIILEALKYIKENYPDKIDNIKVIFTLDDKSSSYEYCKENHLLDVVEFKSTLSYEKVLQHYKSCDCVLFPSYIETFGLPLIEAGKFGKKILVSNCKYSREVLKSYTNVKFISHDNYKEWAKYMIDFDKTEVEFNVDDLEDETWDEFFNLINKSI